MALSLNPLHSVARPSTPATTAAATLPDPAIPTVRRTRTVSLIGSDSPSTPTATKPRSASWSNPSRLTDQQVDDLATGLANTTLAAVMSELTTALRLGQPSPIDFASAPIPSRQASPAKDSIPHDESDASVKAAVAATTQDKGDDEVTNDDAIKIKDTSCCQEFTKTVCGIAERVWDVVVVIFCCMFCCKFKVSDEKLEDDLNELQDIVSEAIKKASIKKAEKEAHLTRLRELEIMITHLDVKQDRIDALQARVDTIRSDLK